MEVGFQIFLNTFPTVLKTLFKNTKRLLGGSKVPDAFEYVSYRFKKLFKIGSEFWSEGRVPDAF